MSRMLSEDEFQQRLIELGVKPIPLDPYVGRSTNIRWQCPDYENHIWEAMPCNVMKPNGKGTGCPFCSGNSVLKGFNDLWTTHPDIASCLKDKELGYVVSYGNCKKVDFECPQCGADIINIRLYDAVRHGLSCSCCNDGISFPERFVASMLNQLGINYIHDNSFNWSNNKRYDFYIPEANIIIETHGEQHYDEYKQWDGDSIEDERANDLDKLNMAVFNGISNYIVLDCKKSDGEYIKSSIFDSKLNELLDLSSVDWSQCEVDSYKSNIIKACELWNNGVRSTKEISKILHLNRVTIVNYLNKGAKHGICDYDGKLQMKLSADKNRPVGKGLKSKKRCA